MSSERVSSDGTSEESRGSGNEGSSGSSTDSSARTSSNPTTDTAAPRGDISMGEAILGMDVVRELKSECSASSVAEYSHAVSNSDGFMIRCPTPEDRICYPGENEVGIYVKNFEHGLRFPLDPFIVELLQFLRVPLSQLYPNSVYLIVAFAMLCRRHKIRPTVSLFQYFFTKKDKKDSSGVEWITICARHGQALLTKFPSSIKGWKTRFVFVRSSEPHPVPARWGTINWRISSWEQLSEAEELSAGLLKSLDDDELIVKNIIDRMDKPASHPTAAAKPAQSKSRKKFQDALKRQRAEATGQSSSPPVLKPTKRPSPSAPEGQSKKRKKTPSAAEPRAPQAGAGAYEGGKVLPEGEPSKTLTATDQAAAPVGGDRLPGGEDDPVDITGSDQGDEGTSRKQATPRGKVVAAQRRPTKKIMVRGNRIFFERQWSEAEEADLELILYSFPYEPSFDVPINQPYQPPFAIDAQDSALTDPTVAARVAQNAYLPADRKGMKPYDNDVLGSNAVATLTRALNLMTEMNTRFHDVSQLHMGLMGFKDRHDEAKRGLEAAEKKVAELQEKLDVNKVEELLEDLKIHKEMLVTANEVGAAKEKRAGELQAEKDELEKKLAEAEEEARRARQEASNKETALKFAAQDAERELTELKRARDTLTLDLEKARAEKTRAEAEIETLRSENEKLKAEKESTVPDAELQAFQAGFDTCQAQIARKFPNHGVDFTQLDACESEPEEEGEAEQNPCPDPV